MGDALKILQDARVEMANGEKLHNLDDANDFASLFKSTEDAQCAPERFTKACDLHLDSVNCCYKVG